MTTRAIYKSRRHFRRSLQCRFKIPRNITQELERYLMRDLFMGRLNILDEDDRGLKIHFPAIHKKCILIFSKETNVFITGYSVGRGRIRKLLNERI